MDLWHRIKDSKSKIPNELLSQGVTEENLGLLKVAIDKELKNGPVMALIGESGVGKTSTVNALFAAGGKVSNVRPGTREPDPFLLSMKGSKGSFTVFDMPGLGETIKADEKHYARYMEILPKCDVVLWIFQADYRAMTNTQKYLRKLVNDGALNQDRLVIGINKVDLIQPGKWIGEINLPSDEQENSIDEYKKYVSEVLEEIGINIQNRIIPYSASMYFRLHELFGAMIESCPKGRGWVFKDRGDPADWREKIDKDCIKLLK